jgi:uroporphyrin-III C-methyltransferase/precorrin-2 dehydrogenase/sirohydrochlorin ferrochelatase
LYPVFLRLAGRPVVVVGGGTVAASKIEGLLSAGAQITVVAPDVRPEIVDSSVTVRRRVFIPADLDGAFYVVAAATAEVNREVAAAAEERHLLVNAVDDVASASVYLGGVVRRDGVVVAISTEGAAPALAGLLREAIDAFLPSDLSTWVSTAQDLRAAWRANRVPMARRRPELLATLNRLYSRRAQLRGHA